MMNLAHQKPFWRLFKPEGLTPRAYPLVCALNDSELLIYGGQKHSIPISEGYIISTESDQLTIIE